MPTVQIDGVGPVQFPDDMSQGEIVQAIERDILPRYSQRPAQPPQGGSALGTALGSVVSGGGGLLSTVGSLGGMVLPGVGYDNALTRAGRDVQQYGESLMSEEMRAKRAALSEAVKQAEDQGLVAEASAALRMLAQNPSLIGSMLLEQIPMFVATGGAGRAAMGAVQLGTRGAVRAAAAGAERQAAAEAAAQLAGRVGTGTAIGTGAALQGGEVAGQAYQDIMSLPDATLANSPAYQALLQRMSGEEARRTLAEEAAQQAGLMGAGISAAAAAALPGAEKALFSKKLSERAVRRVLIGAAGEGAQEAIEEGGGQIAQNIAARRADTERDLTRGAAGAAAIGGTLGAIMGGGIAGVRGPTPPPSEARSPITQQVINDYLAGRDLPPEVEAAAENAIASGQPPAPPSEPPTQAAAPVPPPPEAAAEPTTQAAVTQPVTPVEQTVVEAAVPEQPSTERLTRSQELAEAAGLDAEGNVNYERVAAVRQELGVPPLRWQDLPREDQERVLERLRQQDLSARDIPEVAQPVAEAAAPAGADPKEDLRKARIAERRAERIIKQTADPNKKAFAQVQLAQAQEARAKAEEGIKAQEAAAAKEEQGRLRTAFNRARETINKRLGELENMGTQGKEVADGIRRALDNRAFDSQQLLGAFIGADVLVKQLPGKANHRIDFVEKLIPTEEEIKAVEASGGKLGSEVQGRRDAAKALIELSLSKRFLDPGYTLLRESAAHEAFHVLQDYYKRFDKGFAQALDNAFAKGSDLKDGKAMFADIIKDKSLKNKLQRLRSPAGNMSYFDLLVRDLKSPITPREAQAYVYGALVDSLRRGNQITGVKPGFSRFINFLRDFFSRMGNALSGLGYATTSELLTREAGRGGARFTEELARPAQAQAEMSAAPRGVEINSQNTEALINELAVAAPDIEFSAREGVSLKSGKPDVVEAGNNTQMFWDIEGGGIIFMNAYRQGDVFEIDAIAPEDIKKNPKLKTIPTGSYGPFGLRVPLGITGTRKLIDDITNYLKTRFPEIRYVEGYRITGTRQGLPPERQFVRKDIYRQKPEVEFAARSVGMTTPDFVDWFGESKVSDRNGNPIPAYTGSVNQFNVFDLNATSPDSLYGRGFWFSTNPEMAGGVPRNVSSLEEAYTQGEKAQAGYAFQGRKLTINPPSEDKMDAVKELLTDRYVLGKPELQKLKAAASLGANEFAKEFNKVASAAPRYSRQRDQLINFVSDLDLNSDMAGAATVYPAYLSIQNPFDMSETFTHPNFDGKILRYSFMDENGKIINQSVIDNIWKHWISMFSTKPDFDVKKYSEIFWQDMKREFQSPSVAYRSKETISNEDLYNFMVSSADYENQRNGTNIPPKDMVNEALRYRGYDGIKSTSTDIPSERSLPTGERTKTPSDVWVAFDPTQIKSIFNKFEQGVATQPEFAARQSPLLTDPNYSFYMDALTAQPIARSGLFGGVFRRFVGAMDNTALYGTPNTPERLRDALVRTSVNRNHPIWMLQQLAERMGVLNGRDIGIAAESALMNTGRMQILTQVAGLKFDPTTGDIDIRNDVKSLMEIFEGKVDTKNQDILQRYLIALREKDLRGVGRTGMRSIKGQPFTDQMINDIIQQTEQAHPEFVDVARDLKKFSDSLLDFAVDTGIMTRAKAQELALIFYTPFYREMEADSQSDPNQILGPNVSNVLRNTTSALDKKLGGGDGNVGDLLENILRNADSILRAGLKNHAIKMTAEVARDVGLGQVVQSAAGNNIVTYRVNGNEVHFRVDDPILFTAMATAPAKTRGALHQAMARMASFFRDMITLAPSFMWANLYRGKFQAYAQEGASFSPFTTMKGMKDFLKANPSYLAFTAQTGFGGYTLGMGERNIAAKMKKQLDDRGIFGELMRFNLLAPFSKAIDGLSQISEATELAERLALYERLKGQGMTDKQAAFQAYMLAPFSRQGSGQGVFGNVVQSLIPLVPFLNAKIQGLYRLVENEKGNKTILKIPQQIFLRSMVITAFSTALYGLALSGGNEDELDNLTVDDIIRYDWLFLGEGRKIALPRNFEIGSFFGAVPILAMEAYRKGHTDDLTKAAVSIGTSTLFFNPIPQAVLPILSAVTNYDFFRGRELENYAMRNLPTEDRVDRSTTTAARLASAATGNIVSPIKMQAVLNGYLGSIGSGLMSGFDSIVLANLDVIPGKPAGPFGSPSDIPAILGNASGLGRFYRTDETKVSRFVGDFYTLKEQSNQIKNAINEANLRGDYNRAIELQTEKGQLAMMNRTIARTSTRLSELNRQIRSIEAGPFDSETKLALIAPLRQQRDMLAKQTVQQARAVGAI
jgi:Large polyvalent protein associated domain 38